MVDFDTRRDAGRRGRGRPGSKVAGGEPAGGGGQGRGRGGQVLGVDGQDQVPIVWTEGTSASEFASDIHTLLGDA